VCGGVGVVDFRDGAAGGDQGSCEIGNLGIAVMTNATVSREATVRVTTAISLKV
jgi:hypothetical protein